MGLFSGIFGVSESRLQKLREQNRRLAGQLSRFNRATNWANGGGSFGSVTAANHNRSGAGWPGLPQDEDAANTEYMRSLGEVIQRASNLDVNNPDVHGFTRTRCAQIIGAGVDFKFSPKFKEVGISAAQAVAVGEQVDRLRKIHSRVGGFDSTGYRRSEGKQQERVILTAFITGCCLIHRVARAGRDAVAPMSLELIPGSRISTPYDRAGDPLISYGVQYTDEHRTEVAGFHVRRVSKTVGNQFVPDYCWDFLPIVDCSLFMLTEQAGMDRSMPATLPVVRMLRNRGEAIESSCESFRRQSKLWGVTELAPNDNPFLRAQDDADETITPTGGFPQVGGQVSYNQMPAGFASVGDGVEMLYCLNGEKVTLTAGSLPSPDFEGFMRVTDSRAARGLVCANSTFTRTVDSSWASGRMEAAQDDPIIDQYRDIFVSCWERVNEWFVESLWLAGVVELPGYSVVTRKFWCEFRAEFPGKVSINPVQTAEADQSDLMSMKTSPIRLAEREGTTHREIAREFAYAWLIDREVEKEMGIPENTLGVLYKTRTVSSASGAEITGDPVAPNDPAGDEKSGDENDGGGGGKKNGKNGNGKNHAGVNGENRIKLRGLVG